MTRQTQNVNFIILGILFLLSSCGLSKETVQRIESKPKEIVEFPVDYCNLFPTMTSQQWDKDYNNYERYLTREITQTHMGLSFVDKGVHIWTCYPSARTHVQLDTTTMIKDNSAVIGDWRIVCNRVITYEDSASYNPIKFNRSSKVIKDNKEDDLYLSLTSDKFNFYAKEQGKSSFKTIAKKNYHIVSKRYLMLYGLSKAGAAISFIGMDKEGRLIINAYFVQERKIEREYIVYQATMTQWIFKRMES